MFCFMANNTWQRKREYYRRNWKLYHEELLIRGEFFFDLGFLERWDEELNEMNCNKRGAPYQYPNSLFHWLSPMYSFLDARKLEGALKKLSHYIPKIRACDHSTIVERLNKLEIQLELDRTKNYRLGIDATGNKLTNRGEYIRHKWNVKRGWVKVSIAIDRYTKELLDVEVALDNVTDATLAKKHFENLEDIRITDVAMDGAYYREELYRLLQNKKITPVIKMPKNATHKGFDPMHTRVREMKEMGGYEPWRDAYGYSLRWNNEGYNSATKRCFGECLRSHKEHNCFKEAKMKFINYERMKQYAKSRAST